VEYIQFGHYESLKTLNFGDGAIFVLAVHSCEAITHRN